MEILSDKLLVRLLPEDLQPKKTIFHSTMDMLKKVEVIKKGDNTKWINEGDVVTLYVNSLYNIEDDLFFCVEREVILINDKPQPGKIHIKNPTKISMTALHEAEVVSSNDVELIKGDTLIFKKGQSLVLPDHTEIISESQAFAKK